MAKKAKPQSYQITVGDPAEAAFVRKLLEVYGYQETKPGVFEEVPQRPGRVTRAKPAARKPAAKAVPKVKPPAKKPAAKPAAPIVKKAPARTTQGKAKPSKSPGKKK
jgi:hypothetical protein